MKCPICDGGGRITSLPSGMPVKCTRCNGTGEVEQTNEEWFDSLTTEEKAKVFANATYSTAVAPMEILVCGKEFEQKKWEMWLKEKHNGV